MPMEGSEWIGPLSTTLAQAGDGGAAPYTPGGIPTDAGTTQAPGGGTAAPGAQNQQAPGGMLLFWILPLLLVFMIVSSVLAGRRERKRRGELLASLNKHDRVQTIGGVIGTIQEIRDDEIVLKVDESTNTRIRFARSAVQQVLRAAEGGGGQGGVVDAKTTL